MFSSRLNESAPWSHSRSSIKRALDQYSFTLSCFRKKGIFTWKLFSVFLKPSDSICFALYAHSTFIRFVYHITNWLSRGMSFIWWNSSVQLIDRIVRSKLLIQRLPYRFRITVILLLKVLQWRIELSKHLAKPTNLRITLIWTILKLRISIFVIARWIAQVLNQNDHSRRSFEWSDDRSKWSYVRCSIRHTSSKRQALQRDLFHLKNLESR